MFWVRPSSKIWSPLVRGVQVTLAVILLSLRIPPLKDCGAAYVHWPGPRAASLKMWSPAEQSSQSHPGGHPPVAEDTAVKGLWGSVCTWAGGPRCVVASGRRDHLDVPVVCFLKDYGLWWEGLFPMVRPSSMIQSVEDTRAGLPGGKDTSNTLVRWSRWTRGSALVLGVIFGGGRVTRRCGAVVGEETSSLPSSS